MEPKRELTSVDLAALVTELNGYLGAKVDKAYLYGDDLLRLKLRHFDRGRVELLLEVGDVKRAHVADPSHVPEAPERPPNFAMMLRNRLTGADLADVSQYKFDRILVFEFERGDEDTSLVVELFGQGNVAVLDETGAVVQSLETVRLKSRTVAPGTQYGFPQAGVDPLEMSFEAFVRRMNDSDTDVVRTLATQFNFGGLWAEELCRRAGVEKALGIEDADESTYRRVYDVIGELATRLRAGDLDPRVYLEEGAVVDVTPFPLDERETFESEVYDTFNDAVDGYYRRLDREEEEGGGTDRPDFEAQIAKHERIVQQQEGAIESFDEQAEAEREKAELLYANYELVDEVLTTIRGAREDGVSWDDIDATLADGAEQGIPAAEAVVGVDGSRGTVTITLDEHRVELDVSMGVEKNADQVYQEAKRIEEKKEGALEAIEDTREELEAIKQRRDEWESDDADDEPDDDAFEDVDWLARTDIPVKRPEHWYERFRWFRTSDGFLVIGGRNADQNEEIVKKYLEPHDLFFHTQAHGGPATVVKATGPSEPSREVDIPAQSREEAAQFAVSYSSVWKDGHFAGDVYMVTMEQVSKTPESGEYLGKGGFVIRGDRTYFRDTEVGIAVGVMCEPETRVVGGPPSAVTGQTETSVRLEPGQYAQNDAAKRVYRVFRERFEDQSFVRKVASPDKIQEFLPPGGSRMLDD